MIWGAITPSQGVSSPLLMRSKHYTPQLDRDLGDVALPRRRNLVASAHNPARLRSRARRPGSSGSCGNATAIVHENLPTPDLGGQLEPTRSIKRCQEPGQFGRASSCSTPKTKPKGDTMAVKLIANYAKRLGSPAIRPTSSASRSKPSSPMWRTWPKAPGSTRSSRPVWTSTCRPPVRAAAWCRMTGGGNGSGHPGKQRHNRASAPSSRRALELHRWAEGADPAGRPRKPARQNEVENMASSSSGSGSSSSTSCRPANSSKTSWKRPGGSPGVRWGNRQGAGRDRDTRSRRISARGMIPRPNRDSTAVAANRLGVAAFALPELPAEVLLPVRARSSKAEDCGPTRRQPLSTPP